MDDARLRKMTRTALTAAFVCVATLVLPIPLPGGGYANAGDMVLLTASFFLGPAAAAAAAGFGAATADLILGYTVYAPGTFVIKAADALLAAWIFSRIRHRKHPVPAVITAGICGETVMVAGYYFYDLLLTENAAAAAASVLPDLVQAVLGILGALALTPLVRHVLRVLDRQEGRREDEDDL